MQSFVRTRFVLSLVGVVVSASCAGCEEPQLLSATYALCLAPEEIVFSDQPVRTASTRSVVVTNCGNARIEQLTATLAPTDQPSFEAFQIVATDVPVPMLPGERFNLPIRFRPKDPGAYATELVLEVPEARGGVSERLPIRASAVPLGECDVLIGPDPVQFGALLLGDSASREVTLTNQGSAPCALSGARVTLEHDEFFAIESPPPEAVPPGESVTATLRFSPSEPGPRLGRFSVVIGGAIEISVDLTGTGVSRDTCALFADPSPLTLPRASVGFTTTEGSTLVTSVGELPCAIAASTVTSGAGDFSIAEAPATGTVLQPGESALVTVGFAPAAPGARPGTVTIATDQGVELDIPLAGFADPTPTCALLFEPGTVSFAPIAVGLSAETEVRFRNISEVTCDITNAALASGSEPDFELLQRPALGPLAPGGERIARVRFTAQRPAPALGRLVLALGGGQTSSVDLLGFGAFADLVLTPGFVPYGIVTQTCVSDTVDFRLTNVGPVAARIDQIGFTAATDPNFQLLTAVAPGTLIAPGERFTLPVRMLGAPQPGSHHGNLEVLSTGTLDPRERAEVTGETGSIADAARTDVFTQRERPVIDILFVIDNSGSMSEEQANLTQNFDRFIRFTTELDIDYQIGIITTEATGANAGKLRGPIIANTGVNASSDPIGDFIAQARVGTNGSADERGLQASVLALTEPNISGPNFGFLRQGALLSIIYISDEEDHSPGDVSGYLDTLLSVKGYDADAIIASAIAGDVPSGCSSTGAGSAQAGRRYLDVVNALQGVFASICRVDWSTTMEEIGLGTFQALTRFQLSREPDLSTMIVEVDGVVVPASELNGWSYDAVSNSVKFNGTAVPAAGQEIVITYTAECIEP
jgi:hypothetical protein